jgi:hypothetical protein
VDKKFNDMPDLGRKPTDNFKVLEVIITVLWLTLLKILPLIPYNYNTLVQAEEKYIKNISNFLLNMKSLKIMHTSLSKINRTYSKSKNKLHNFCVPSKLSCNLYY